MYSVNDKNKKTLPKEICKMREKLISMGQAKGLTNTETILLSQRLDLLLNKYQTMV